MGNSPLISHLSHKSLCSKISIFRSIIAPFCEKISKIRSKIAISRFILLSSLIPFYTFLYQLLTASIPTSGKTIPTFDCIYTNFGQTSTNF